MWTNRYELGSKDTFRQALELMYINSMSYITADVHQLQATHRLQVTVTRRQYDLLAAESDRTALSIAELVRRCIDSTLRPRRRLRYRGLELVLTVSPEVDPALTGRRVRLKGQTGARRRPIREED